MVNTKKIIQKRGYDDFTESTESSCKDNTPIVPGQDSEFLGTDLVTLLRRVAPNLTLISGLSWTVSFEDPWTDPRVGGWLGEEKENET